MKTIIHIGQHKTGTTSIQQYLRTHKDELSDQGLYVPHSLAGYDQAVSHFILNIYALNQHRSSPMKDNLLRHKPKSFFSDLRQVLEDEIANHYERARSQGCNEVIWSNEGLYLLNSLSEYSRLLHLFDDHSSSVTCICCFRDPSSFRESYMKQLQKKEISFSDDKDSYRYVEPDSWLYDYRHKEELLAQVFDRVVTFPYNNNDMVKTFMQQIGYLSHNTHTYRLNMTKSEQ